MRNITMRFRGELARDDGLKAAGMAVFDDALNSAGLRGDDQRFIARLVFGEAITNAQVHRQNGETEPVRYKLIVSPFSCFFQLNYQSRPFVTERDLPDDFDDHHRGIPLMRDLSHRMVYQFFPGRVDLSVDMLLWDLS